MLTQEAPPEWLVNWSPGTGFSAEDFFSSRVVFYPGSGSDGQPVRFFGIRHAAHCFVYADYLVERGSVEHELSDAGHPFHGYRGIGRLDLTPRDLTPHGWHPHLPPQRRYPESVTLREPYAFLEILERMPDRTDAHGPLRLSILFLGAEGVATYDALFCQDRGAPPFAIVLQDNGFGGNWTTFGRDGALHDLARRTSRWPSCLLVAGNTRAWPGYRHSEGQRCEAHPIHPRELYLQDTARP